MERARSEGKARGAWKSLGTAIEPFSLSLFPSTTVSACRHGVGRGLATTCGFLKEDAEKWGLLLLLLRASPSQRKERRKMHDRLTDCNLTHAQLSCFPPWLPATGTYPTRPQYVDINSCAPHHPSPHPHLVSSPSLPLAPSFLDCHCCCSVVPAMIRSAELSARLSWPPPLPRATLTMWRKHRMPPAHVVCRAPRLADAPFIA